MTERVPTTGRDGTLSPDEYRRYARHLALPEFGEAAQRALKRGRVLLVGAGGLGSPAALYLVAAGVGTIGIVDDDLVDEANLQRQILHGTGSVGRPKLESAAARLRDLNPHVQLELFPVRLTADNALRIIEPFDIVVDGSDNFPARYLVNDACVLLGKPDVYGAVFRFEGQVSIFAGPDGPCYRCLFRDPPPPEVIPSCEAAGVLGAIPGLIGSLQALETIKLLTGVGFPLVGRLVMVDGLHVGIRELQVRRDPDCPVCGAHPTVTALIDYEAFCQGKSAGGAVAQEIDPLTLAEQLRSERRPLLVDVREPWEWEIARLDGAELMPLGELALTAHRLERGRPIVAYCHVGVRSLVAIRILKAMEFADVSSLRGGIEAWARDVDRSVARY
ncbi:MAG TPA: molybdopterin-synthase adenylyltransferase MoeB [Gemmatimonadales bacterium]